MSAEKKGVPDDIAAEEEGLWAKVRKGLNHCIIWYCERVLGDDEYIETICAL